MTSASAARDPAVAVTDLGFSYPDGTRALEDVTVSVEAGEVLGLLGPNGCGKTTLLRLLARAAQREMPGVRIAPGHPALALDQPAFPHWLSGRDLAHSLLGMRGLPNAVSAANEWLSRFDLEESVGRPVGSYSRGTAQRLQLAIAFASGAAVLLLDEPLGGLDPEARQRFVHALRAAAGRGAAVLLTTHDTEFAAAHCERVAFMSDGALLAVDTPASFLAGLSREGRIEVAFTVGGAPPAAVLANPPDDVSGLERTADGLLLSSADPAKALPGVVGWLGAGGARMASVTVHETGLRDAYFALTGQTLASRPSREPGEHR